MLLLDKKYNLPCALVSKFLRVCVCELRNGFLVLSGQRNKCLASDHIDLMSNKLTYDQALSKLKQSTQYVLRYVEPLNLLFATVNGTKITAKATLFFFVCFRIQPTTDRLYFMS